MTLYTLFDETPALGPMTDPDALSLGTEFYVTAPVWVTGFRYLCPVEGDTAQRTAALYSTADGGTGTLLTEPLTMPLPVSGEWISGDLPAPYALEPGVRYRSVIFHPTGNYVATGGYFDSGPGSLDRVTGPVVRPNRDHALSYLQGSYAYGASIRFPSNQFNGASYYADVLITDVDPDLPPPVIEADVLLSVGEARGHSLALGSPYSSPLVVLPPTGHPLTPTEATL